MNKSKDLASIYRTGGNPAGAGPEWMPAGKKNRSKAPASCAAWRHGLNGQTTGTMATHSTKAMAHIGNPT